MIAQLWMILVGATMLTGGTAATPEDQFEWAAITHPGNPAYEGNEHGIHAGRGRVDYVFRLSRHEVSTGDWFEFANAFSTQSDELDELLFQGVFWHARPDFDYRGPGTRYILPSGPHDVARAPIGISWRHAAMYCNWLHNGKSTDPNALLDGAYDVSTFGKVGADHTDQDTRHLDARFWIPSLDEFLKAAYFDPNKNGQGPGWWTYGHSSDDTPEQGLPGEGHTVVGMPWDEIPGGPTGFPLGSYADVISPWGLYDVIGGHGEYTEEWLVDGFGNRRGRLHKNSYNTHWWDPIQDEVWNFQHRVPSFRGHTSFRVATLPGCFQDSMTLDRDVDPTGLLAYLHQFLAGQAAADRVEPFGVVDLFDLLDYVAQVQNGCEQQHRR